jgi:hypothetical protein
MRKRDTSFLEEFNYTELVAIAEHNEIPGFHQDGNTKGIPREVLEQMIANLEPCPRPEPLMNYRERITEWAHRWWSRLQPQIQPGYTQCPKCVEGQEKKGVFRRCSDVQVMDCYLRNERSIR